MKILRALLTVAVFGSILRAQTGLNDQAEGKAQGHVTLSAAEYATQMIRRLITSGHPLEANIPRLHRMGDGAAAEILKVMGTRGPLSTTEQLTVLDIIH